MLEHCLLQFHIITDSAKFGENRRNLSVHFFLEWDWGGQVRQRLSLLADKLKKFVDFKSEDNPRHKLLAHWDVETILCGPRALGAFDEGDDFDFFENLNEFIEVMGFSMGLKNEWSILSADKADERKLVDIIESGIS